MMYAPRALQRKVGFTLIELLVVIAIIAILAAILFPVFAQAKAAAKKTASISNFKQAGTGTAMYLSDNDDTFMLSNSGSLPGNCWGCGPPDALPMQVLQPCMKNTRILVDPMDPWQSEDQRLKDQIACCMTLSNPPTPTANEKMYALAVRSNIGYNYAFLSPWRYVNMGALGYYAGSAAINAGEVGNPANTLMWGTSIWDRAGGAPTGGGNWVIETPCWLDSAGEFLQPMRRYAPGVGDGTLFRYTGGWDATGSTWLVYGGLWPFYNQTSLSNISPGLVDGHVVTGFADTHVRSMPIKAITMGCSAYQSGTNQGKVGDKDKFIWDLE